MLSYIIVECHDISKEMIQLSQFDYMFYRGNKSTWVIRALSIH